MRELRVTLKTVTPLFLAGVDSRGNPELRSPAFRGATRYWLRALLGGVIGDRNLKGLHQLENQVYGSNDNGSPITIRLQSKEKLSVSSAQILPHKPGNQRLAFDADQPIEILISQPRGDSASWKSACSSLSLMLTLGGVGLRSRRGYGTLRITNSSDPSLIPITPTSAREWEPYIQTVIVNGITAASDLAQNYGFTLAALPSNPPDFPCASKFGTIRICDIRKTTAMEAITDFMSKVPKNDALGGIGPRQSSPLWIHPVQADGQYTLLLTVLASNFKGNNYPFVQSFLDTKFPGKDIPVKGWNA